MADLIQPARHIPCGIEPRHAGALVRVDLNAAFFGCLGAKVERQTGTDQRTECGVDGIERKVSRWRRHKNCIAGNAQGLARPVQKLDPGICQALPLPILHAMLTVRRDERDIS